MTLEPANMMKTEDERLNDELVCELRLLRTLVREVGESFILRREGEIEAILTHIEGMPRRTVRREAPEMLRQLHRLKLKPRKGRLRDLKDISRLVDEFMDALVELQGEECRHEAARRMNSSRPSDPLRRPLAVAETP